MSAPGSLASRRLMMDAYPIFLISATAAGVIAPAHATVLSSFAKLLMPGTDSFFTWDCPAAMDTPIPTMTKMETIVLILNSNRESLCDEVVYNRRQLLGD